VDREAGDTEWFVEFLRPSRGSSLHAAFFTTACGFAFTLACSLDPYIAVQASGLILWFAYCIFRTPLRETSNLLLGFAGGFTAYIVAVMTALFLGLDGLLPPFSAFLLCGALTVLLRFNFVSERIAVYEQAEAKAEPEFRHRRRDLGVASIRLYAETEVARRPKRLLNTELEVPVSRRIRRWLSSRVAAGQSPGQTSHGEPPDPEVGWRH